MEREKERERDGLRPEVGEQKLECVDLKINLTDKKSFWEKATNKKHF